MKTGLDLFAADIITNKLSAVINPIDDFSGDRPLGRVHIALEGLSVKPVRNPGGFYVFVKLHPGVYRFTIESDYYLPCDGVLTISQSSDTKPHIVDIRLIPSVNYSFSPDCTLIRGAVTDKNGHAVRGALVIAGILPPGQRVPRLGKVNSISGNTMEAVLDNPANAIESFNILKLGTTGNKVEMCRVKEVLKKEASVQSILLQDRLIYSHTGHVINLVAVDAVETRSSNKGEFVIYFRSVSESVFGVKLETSFENKKFTCMIKGSEQESVAAAARSTTYVKVIEN
jgi:hypothetical protein